MDIEENNNQVNLKDLWFALNDLSKRFVKFFVVKHVFYVITYALPGVSIYFILYSCEQILLIKSMYPIRKNHL